MDSLRALLVLRPGLRVADLGCGSGHLGRLLWPALAPGGHIDGFDADPAQIVAARGLASPGARFEEADARCVPRPAQSYDRVVCQALLVHQARPEEVVREMVRLTRPGGLVAVVEPRWPSRTRHPATDPAMEAMGSRVATVAAAAAVRAGLGDWSVADRLPALFRDHGLEAVRTWVHPGLVAVPAGVTGTGEQRLLRALTHPVEEVAEEQLQGSLAADVCAPAELQAVASYRGRVRAARRDGLRAGSWWEWREHPLVVCVGTRGAV